MFGSTKENVLNTTLFLKNITDLSYICIDAAENLYVFNMYKFSLFGNDWTNVLLGALQNLLGSILTINKIYQRIVDHSEKKNEVLMAYEFGKIFQLVTVFDPVIIEDSGFSFSQNRNQNPR